MSSLNFAYLAYSENSSGHFFKNRVVLYKILVRTPLYLYSGQLLVDIYQWNPFLGTN